MVFTVCCTRLPHSTWFQFGCRVVRGMTLFVQQLWFVSFEVLPQTRGIDSQCFGLTKALINSIGLRPSIDFVYNGDVIAGRICFDMNTIHAQPPSCNVYSRSLGKTGLFTLVAPHIHHKTAPPNNHSILHGGNLPCCNHYKCTCKSGILCQGVPIV